MQKSNGTLVEVPIYFGLYQNAFIVGLLAAKYFANFAVSQTARIYGLKNLLGSKNANKFVAVLVCAALCKWFKLVSLAFECDIFKHTKYVRQS